MIEQSTGLHGGLFDATMIEQSTGLHGGLFDATMIEQSTGLNSELLDATMIKEPTGLNSGLLQYKRSMSSPDLYIEMRITIEYFIALEFIQFR